MFIKLVLKYSIQYIQSLLYAEHMPAENHLILLSPHLCYDFWKLLTVVFYYPVSYVLTKTNFCFNYLRRSRSGFVRLTQIKNKKLCAGSDPHLDTKTCLVSSVLLLSYQIQRPNRTHLQTFLELNTYIIVNVCNNTQRKPQNN